MRFVASHILRLHPPSAKGFGAAGEASAIAAKE
jgi:hypothetical protein